MKMISFFLFLSLYISQAFSGQELGNGGDLVVCYKKDWVSIISLEVLDFHEGRLNGLKIDMTEGKNYQEMVEEVIDRIRPLSEGRADLYRKYYQEFLNEANFVSDVILQDIDDSSYIKLERGCRIEQIAYQLEQLSPDDPPYLISLDLWNKLDDKNKAGLILHEIIYKEFLTYTDQEDSRNVRKFTAYLSSELFKKTRDLKTFYDYTKNLYLGLAGFKNYLFKRVELSDYFQIKNDDYFYLSGLTDLTFITNQLQFLGKTYEVKGIGLDFLGELLCIELEHPQREWINGKDFQVLSLCQRNGKISHFKYLKEEGNISQCEISTLLGLSCD